MKKTFLIALTLLTNFVFAQTQLSDYYDASSANRREFSYNIVVKIHKTTGATEYDTRYTATLVQASPDSKGFYNAYGDNKYYSCSQLGDVCKPNNLHLISIRLSYTCNGQQKADVVVFRNLNDVQQINTVYGAGGKLCESLDFSMKVMGVVIEPIHLGQIMNKINQIGTTKTTQNNSNNNNPTTQTNSEDTQTNETKSYELKLSDIGISENNSSTTNKTQQITQISNSVSPLLDEWGNHLQKKRQEEERIAQEEAEQKLKGYEAYVKNKLFREYLSDANQGNEDSRMTLIFEILSFKNIGVDLIHMLPDWKNWIIHAVKNKNLDAMNFAGYQSIYNLKSYGFSSYSKEEGIKILEEAINLNSLDAMFTLAEYYDRKKDGGNDYLKAFELYLKAANLGHPDANYAMSKIYRNKCTNGMRSMFVKYKIETNDNLAFKYTYNSVFPKDYNESLYHKYDRSHYISFYPSSVYSVLSVMYEQGIGCEINLEIAKKLLDESKTK